MPNTRGASPVPCASSRPLDPTRPRREYLSAEQLARVTPWSVEAIQKMVQRGLLQRDVHYFQPFGQRTQLVFKWSAIVALIEDRGLRGGDTEGARVVEQGGLDVETATAELSRLLGR